MACSKVQPPTSSPRHYSGVHISKQLDLLGSMDPICHSTVHINRFGIVPKSYNTGKWHLITDLSYPPGKSVNDGIDHNTSVDDVSMVGTELGQGTLMAKVTIEAAYRLVPVHLHDRPLLGMEWKAQDFADPKLPFGLWSVPKIFNAIADTLEWYLKSLGNVHIFRYLDNFTIIESLNSDECMGSLNMMQQA